MDLQIESPGTFTATAKNAKRFKLVVVKSGSGLTPEALQANPNWSGQGLLYAEELPDSGGKAAFDLARRQDELAKKAKELKLKTGAALESFIVGFAPDGTAQAVKGPAITWKKDVIPIGSAIEPPRPWDVAKERAWFGKLEETSFDELQPGDILIRKAYAGSPVADAQAGFNTPHGSKYSTHVMVWAGGGKVAHAYEGTMTVRLDPPPPHHIVAYRATDAQQAASAAEVARWLTTLGIEYSVADCLRGVAESSSWGPNAQERAAKVARREKPLLRSMCSCFATLCYQGTPGAYIQLDAQHVSPSRLEDYLNANPAKFRFAGAIPGTVEGGGEISKADMIKMGFESVVGEAADHAKAGVQVVAKAADKAVDKVADKAKDVGGKVIGGLKKLF